MSPEHHRPTRAVALAMRGELEPCPYLPDETMRMEYRFVQKMSDDHYAEWLERGWRRFGRTLFRPTCPVCRKCRGLRLDVSRFRPNRSQRRNLRRNGEVRVEVVRATVSDTHLRLFDAYHRDMHARRNWPYHPTSEAEYHSSFLDGDWPFAFELRHYRDDQLVGVALADLLPDAVSAVYFYHDPQWRDDGPGTWSILNEIEWARSAGRRYVYLGYWIATCRSLSYKSNFKPHELLDEFVSDSQEPVWRDTNIEAESEAV